MPLGHWIFFKKQTFIDYLSPTWTFYIEIWNIHVLMSWEHAVQVCLQIILVELCPLDLIRFQLLSHSFIGILNWNSKYEYIMKIYGWNTCMGDVWYVFAEIFGPCLGHFCRSNTFSSEKCPDYLSKHQTSTRCKYEWRGGGEWVIVFFTLLTKYSCCVSHERGHWPHMNCKQLNFLWIFVDIAICCITRNTT